jgi:DNA primase
MSLQNQMPVSTAIEADKSAKDIIDSQNININSNIISQKINKSTRNFKIFEINIFSQVKNDLDIRQMLEYYGVSINGKGFASCPFHREHTPSFKVYDNSFYCFGCGESGTVIDFVMKYFRLTNIEAVKKLNEDFKLNLQINGNVGAAYCRSTQESKNLVQSFVEWEKQAFITVSSYFRVLRFWGEQIFVNQVEYFDKYLGEVENIVFVETMLDLMIANTNDFPAQVEFYRDFGEAVSLIEQKLYA